MKKLQNSMILLALVPLMVLVSCKDEDIVPENESFNILTTYMAENNLDLPDVLDGWITSAPATEADAAAFISSSYIIDLRSASDYNAGHIQGAVNASYSNLIATAANSNGKPIVVVCYTGQTASQAVVALRLSGYPTAKTLKFGMAGWSSQYKSSWENNLGSSAVGHGSWIKPADVKAEQ